MSDSSEQVEVLRLIWQELKDLGRNLGGRIDETNRRLDSVRTELKDEISGLRTELKGEIAGLRSELKADISDLRDDHAELRRVMAESHVRLATEVTAWPPRSTAS